MGKMRKVIRPEYKRLQKALGQLGNASVRTGWFANSAYPDKNHTKVAYVATIQENGVPSEGIPARPFMAPTAEREKGRWQDNTETLVASVMDGKRTAQQALTAFALMVEADISKSIDMVQEPPLAKSTVEARARKRRQTVEQVSKKPLIDSGLMQSTITSEVKV